jgi:hypothetical protein
VAESILAIEQHNVRPKYLYMAIIAPGFYELMTAL